MITIKDNGITLVEILVAAAIVSVLAVALGFEFRGWLGGYRVESQIRTMHLDLIEARVRAMLRRRVHFLSLSETYYTVQEDIHPWPNGDRCLTPSDTMRPAGYSDPIPLMKRTLDQTLPITWNNIRVRHVKFNRRGFSNTNRTICVNSAYNADYDCIAISAGRIRLGKLKKKIPDGGKCDAANCMKK